MTSRLATRLSRSTWRHKTSVLIQSTLRILSCLKKRVNIDQLFDCDIKSNFEANNNIAEYVQPVSPGGGYNCI